MCSHESITWKITDNYVTDRMVKNSLLHKFKSSRKIRRRTKALNAIIKKNYIVKDYKHYVELKTSVLRNLENDTDTDDSSNLSDIDYDMIYTPAKRVRQSIKNFERYFTSEEDCKDYERNVVKSKSKDKNMEKRMQMRKLSQMNTTVSKKSINTGWQEVINNSISHSHKQMNNLDNENVLESNDYNHSKAQSNKRSLSSTFDSRNDMATQSTCLEDNNDSTNELSSLVRFNTNSGNKSTTVINKSSVKKSHDNTYTTDKPKLKNVKRNLLLTLENVDSVNNDEDSKTDKSVENKLNYDQLLPDSTNVNIHSTPLKKTRTIKEDTNNPKDLSLDTLSQDLQKDSGIDEDSQDRFVKMKGSNKMEKTLVSSPQLEAVDEEVKIVENCNEVVKDAHVKLDNDISGEQISKKEEKPSREVKNSPQLNQIDMNIETNQENEEDEHFAKVKGSNDIQKQQLLSPKKDCMKEARSELCNLTQKDEDNRKVKKPTEEEKVSFQLNMVDNAKADAEIFSINREGKQDTKEEEESSEGMNFLHLSEVDDITEISSISHQDQTDFVKSKDSNDIQKQQRQSPKKNHIKDVHPNSNNILDEDNEQANEKKGKNCLQLNQVFKDTKMHLINEEDKTCVWEDTHEAQKQQPKVMCTEILNKKYKIIDKKDNDVNSSIEKIDNNNSKDTVNECTPIKKNTVIHCPDVTERNTDNWQEVSVNEEDIDSPMALESDNEEDNVNYMSPQTKKRLQQQARLNLVVNSDSSESDNGYLITKTSREHIDSSDASHSSEDDRLKNNETNSASKQTKMDVSCSGETVSVPVEVIKHNSTNMKEGIKKKDESLINCTYENNNLFQSATNKDSLKGTQNVPDDRSQDESFQLKGSKSNTSCNNEESINHFRGHKQSLLNKNICTKSDQNKERRRESEHEQSEQSSVKSSNAHLNVSCQDRPRNLKQLVEDQELIVEMMPASFTLANLSEDEEAFILNVPNKVLQNNLQGQLLTLKDKSIKFNESKYGIVCKEVGTTSCVFATGKERKPYKIINIKKISTITVREKLPQGSRKLDVSNSHNSVSSKPKSVKKSDRDRQMPKISNQMKYK